MKIFMDIHEVKKVKVGKMEYIPTECSRWLVKQEIVFELEDGTESRITAVLSQSAAKEYVDQMIAAKNKAA